MDLVFVYGTLKRGCGNYPCLNGQEFVGKAAIGNGYTLYDCGHGFPFLVADGGPGCVGELFRVDDRGLMRLDGLEGHPTFYERKKCVVFNDKGDELEAWVYIYPRKPSAETEAISEWKED